MADLGSITQKINELPRELRAPMIAIFTEILKSGIRFGHPNGEQPDPCLNIGGGFFHGTTAATPGDSFTIAHGFGRTPYLAHRVLLLDTVGSTDGVLTVTRAADDKRFYFSSTETSAPISIFAEG